MFPDRKLQLEILEKLKAVCPRNLSLKDFSSFAVDDNFATNLWYLEKHNLIKAHLSWNKDDSVTIGRMSITQDGVDFLEDDGGIGAMLKKVHIKFDSNDLKLIIASQIDKTNLPGDEKTAMKNILTTIKSDGMKAVVTELVKTGITKTPDLMQLIQTALTQVF